MRKARVVLATIGTMALLASCNAAPPTTPGAIPMREFMGHVMFHNAERFWAWTALEIDRSGEHDARPKDAAQWEAAESDALTIDQLAIVLAQPGYRIDDPRWDAQLAALRATARDSAQAAEAKDFGKLVAAGNRLNERCVSCHTMFAPELEAIPTPAPRS
jgi:hypothetical protein